MSNIITSNPLVELPVCPVCKAERKLNFSGTTLGRKVTACQCKHSTAIMLMGVVNKDGSLRPYIKIKEIFPKPVQEKE